MLPSSPERTRMPSLDATVLAQTDPEILTPLCEINESSLRALVALASDGASEQAYWLLSELRGIWCSLDEEALHRAASYPALLLDFSRWNCEIDARVPNSIDGPFQRAEAIPLMRSAMMLAWHASRTEPHTAGIRLGLSAPDVQTIRKLPLCELESIVQAKWPILRPRWHKRTGLWRKLLLAAQSDSPESFTNFSLHALHALLDELLPRQLARQHRQVLLNTPRQSGRSL